MDAQTKQSCDKKNNEAYFFAQKKTVAATKYALVLALKQLAAINNTTLEQQAVIFLNAAYIQVESLSEDQLNEVVSELNK